MRFQKTTEHAIRVMSFLAMHEGKRFSVNTLHRELNIPYKYLGRLMSKLAQSGMVEVEHGKHGGYHISRDIRNIYLYEIMEIVEGLDDYHRCILGFPSCSDENPCALHFQWLKIRDQLSDLLYSTSLSDLIKSGKLRI